jgi:hypothetical protein
MTMSVAMQSEEAEAAALATDEMLPAEYANLAEREAIG